MQKALTALEFTLQRVFFGGHGSPSTLKRELQLRPDTADFLEALRGAVSRRVEVRVLIDYVGAHDSWRPIALSQDRPQFKLSVQEIFLPSPFNFL